ncbi:MAG TPA: hypothetical protein VIF35_16160 [Streptosporangiaceae bacterium]
MEASWSLRPSWPAAAAPANREARKLGTAWKHAQNRRARNYVAAGWRFTYQARMRRGLAGLGPARGPHPRRLRRQKLSGRMKLAIAGVIIGLILFAVSPIAAVVVIVLAIGIPTGMYLMLDPAQRRRLKEVRRRKQIGG